MMVSGAIAWLSKAVPMAWTFGLLRGLDGADHILVAGRGHDVGSLFDERGGDLGAASDVA